MHRPGWRILALGCLLMMPIQFKGGAEQEHPHAFFQFWGRANEAAHHHQHGTDRRTGETPPAMMVIGMDQPDSTGGAIIGSPGSAGAGQLVGIDLFLVMPDLTLAIGKYLFWPYQSAAPAGQTITPPVPPPRSGIRAKQ